MAHLSKQVIVSCFSLALFILTTISLNRVSGEQKSTRLSRMPLMYGKRSSNSYKGNHHQASSRSQHLDALRKAAALISFENNGVSNRFPNNRGDSGMMKQFAYEVYPLGIDFDESNQFNEQEDAVNEVLHTYNLPLMPKYFEKPSITTSQQEFTILKRRDNHVKRKASSILNRMPTFYGKRNNPNNNFDVRNPVKPVKVLKRGSLQRMPTFYGKRAHNLILATRKNENTFLKAYTNGYQTNLLDEDLRHLTGEGGRATNLATIFLRLFETDTRFRRLEDGNNIEADTKWTVSPQNRNINDVGTYETIYSNSNNSSKTGAVNDVNGISISNVDSVNDISISNVDNVNDISISNVDNINTYPKKKRYSSQLDRMPHFFGKREVDSLTSIPTSINRVSRLFNSNRARISDMPTSLTSDYSMSNWNRPHISHTPAHETSVSSISNSNHAHISDTATDLTRVSNRFYGNHPYISDTPETKDRLKCMTSLILQIGDDQITNSKRSLLKTDKTNERKLSKTKATSSSMTDLQQVKKHVHSGTTLSKESSDILMRLLIKHLNLFSLETPGIPKIMQSLQSMLPVGLSTGALKQDLGGDVDNEDGKLIMI